MVRYRREWYPDERITVERSSEMKKFLFSLLVLLLLAAVVFGFGYVPLRTQVGSVTLLFSKTSGWDSQPIEPGVFAWRWELLIPTNTQIIHFPDQKRSVRVERSDILPSAELYAQFLEGKPSLEQRVIIQVSFRPTPQWIASLAPRGLEPGDLGEQLQFIDQEIKTATGVFLESVVHENLENALLRDDALSSTLLAALSQRFPEVDLIAVVVEELHMPDLALWRSGREAYNTVQTARQAALAATASVTAQEDIARERMITAIERFGTVFQEYPVILEYLQIVATTGRDPLNLNMENLPSITVPDLAP